MSHSSVLAWQNGRYNPRGFVCCTLLTDMNVCTSRVIQIH